jgi:hypothetical protein
MNMGKLVGTETCGGLERELEPAAAGLRRWLLFTVGTPKFF